MKAYYVNSKIYRNGKEVIELSQYNICRLISKTDKQDRIYKLNWENIEKFFEKFGIEIGFNLFKTRKGLMVCFYHDKLFPPKDLWAIKQWKDPFPNLEVCFEYKEYEPSLKEILDFEPETAIPYLKERGQL